MCCGSRPEPEQKVIVSKTPSLWFWFAYGLGLFALATFLSYVIYVRTKTETKPELPALTPVQVEKE